MQERSRTETKRAVCRAFTNVIGRSALADAVDPKSFLLMLNTQFPVLYRGGRLYLAPLWEAMIGAGVPREMLPGLFVRFAQIASELAIPAELPAEVSAMSAEQQHVEVLRLLGSFPQSAAPMEDPSGFTPLVELEPLTPSEPLPAIQLASADLKPIIPDDLKRRVSIAVQQAVRTTPLGTKVESAQVAYLVDQNFETLCDGVRFDFAPLVQAIREVPNVTDTELHVTALKLVELLAPLGVEVKVPELSVDRTAAQAMIAELAPARRGASIVAGEPRPLPVAPRPTTAEVAPDEAPKSEEPPTAETKREGRLRKWGLTGRSDSKFARYVRPGILVALLVVVGAVGWLNRPSRALDPDDFSVFPMRSAALEDGFFQGSIDEARWAKLKYKEREAAVDALEQLLRKKGMLEELQVRDSKNRLVLVGNSGRLKPSRALMRDGLPPGDVPPPEDTPKPPAKHAPAGQPQTPPAGQPAQQPSAQQTPTTPSR
ncbi:hypothetical protein L6R52_17730 [Myxococcota bacterium]|nr:hypothetical protein [Myxococcota bacterium]